MRQRPGRARADSVAKVVGGMGRERQALLARRTTIVLLQVCALVCLLAAAASFAGYLPHAVGPAIVLSAASAAGFFLSIIEARKA